MKRTLCLLLLATVLLSAGCDTLQMQVQRSDLQREYLRAVRQNDAVAVRGYLAQGGDVNARDPFGRSAVALAQANGCDDVLRILQAAGGRCGTRSGYG